MLQERLTVPYRATAQSEKTGLLISALNTDTSGAEIVIGRPGLKNLRVKLILGDAVLFETPEGLFEIRVLANSAASVALLVTQISPRPGIAAGLVDQNPENTPFLPQERDRIARSVEEIKVSMSSRPDIQPEQLRYLFEKLDEMSDASERLGRKDWINFALGSVTSVIISAAFDPVAAKALLDATDAALFWVFGAGIKLLP
jgi:hypothetical protein